MLAEIKVASTVADLVTLGTFTRDALVFFSSGLAGFCAHHHLRRIIYKGKH